MERRKRLIIDTHIWIKWIGEGKLPSKHRKLLNDADLQKCLSCFSIWEVAMLAAKKRITLNQDIVSWTAQALERSQVELIPLSPSIAILSCDLPGSLHGDPADRIIVASALAEKIALLTEDKEIIRYAKKGHLKLAAA